MYIRTLSNEDSEKIATLHLNTFINFFLTSLGFRFLKIFYYSVLTSKYGYGIGVFNNEDLYAFAVGSTKTNGFYKILVVKNLISYVWALLPVLFNNPRIIIHIIFSLLNEKNLDTKDYGKATSVLLSICSNPNFRGQGLGKKALFEFENLSLSKGFTNILLTTDANNNDGVNLFYKSNGYNLVGNYMTREGRKMNRYIKGLRPE